MGAFHGQILDRLEQMADRARQTIEPYDDKGVSGADFTQELRQGRADTRDAPEPCSCTMASQPVERSSISWASVACSSVETRA